MRNKNLYFFYFLFVVAFLVSSCRPINIFSPLIDPSKMGNDAKLDAGYNALSEGDYDKAIDYFTDVIQSASGDDLVDAYLGRGAAYLRKSSPNIDSVVEDLLSGDLEVDNPGAIVTQVVAGGDYTSFFSDVEKAAADYNSAFDNITGEVDIGVLFEVYQTNMMAATGVGATKIATDYNTSPWDLGSITLNDEIDAIIDTRTHPYDIDTWEDSVLANNGLRNYVYVDGTQNEETKMRGYLTNAHHALEKLKPNPPEGMSEQDVTDMQKRIEDWAYYGLDPSLGTP
jgi:tetratricopeptide (TPR) repeat protein